MTKEQTRLNAAMELIQNTIGAEKQAFLIVRNPNLKGSFNCLTTSNANADEAQALAHDMLAYFGEHERTTVTEEDILEFLRKASEGAKLRSEDLKSAIEELKLDVASVEEEIELKITRYEGIAQGIASVLELMGGKGQQHDGQ